MSVKPRDVPGLRDRLIGNINRALGNLPDAVNDQPVADLDDMLGLLEQRQIGEKVVLSVWRSGQTRRVIATLGSSD